MITDEKKEWAKATLRERAEELGRIPNKDDFDGATLSRIKAFLGPWPRALEAAGIKEPRSDDRIEKNRDKRARAKRNRIMALKRLEKERKKQAARNGGGQS